nr:hypothetical protein Iba_chr05cCG1290 [Ipomoea batatas]
MSASSLPLPLFQTGASPPFPTALLLRPLLINSYTYHFNCDNLSNCCCSHSCRLGIWPGAYDFKLSSPTLFARSISGKYYGHAHCLSLL